jgi:hypothetical protein
MLNSSHYPIHPKAALPWPEWSVGELRRARRGHLPVPAEHSFFEIWIKQVAAGEDRKILQLMRTPTIEGCWAQCTMRLALHHMESEYMQTRIP